MTMTSTALLIDASLGLTLLLLNIALAAACEGLALCTCGIVDINAMWYRWIVTAKSSLDAAAIEKELRQVAPEADVS